MNICHLLWQSRAVASIPSRTTHALSGARVSSLKTAAGSMTVSMTRELGGRTTLTSTSGPIQASIMHSSFFERHSNSWRRLSLLNNAIREKLPTRADRQTCERGADAYYSSRGSGTAKGWAFAVLCCHMQLRLQLKRTYSCSIHRIAFPCFQKESIVSLSLVPVN